MKNYTAIFQRHLAQKIKSLGLRQSDVVRETGISQASISKIMNHNCKIRMSTLCSLWPFVYGEPFPMPDGPKISSDDDNNRTYNK